MKRLSLLVIGCVMLFGSVASAVTGSPTQPAPANGNIALTPAIQDKVLGPDEKSVSFLVQLSNQSDKPITFALSSTDFTTLNQTGGLTFLGSSNDRVTKGHGLSSILELDAAQVTVAAKGSRAVIVRVPDVSKLAPGGHYGAVLAQALPDGTATNGNKVTVNQVVSSLIFLETAGQGTKTLTLLSPQLSKLSFSLPADINLAFKATGNTQTVPRGLVTISRGDTIVMRSIINENSSLLLPGSTRLLATELTGERKPLRPGMYTFRVQYRYEGSLGITTYEKTILYVNVQAILGLVLLLVVGSYVGYRIRKYAKNRPPKIRKETVKVDGSIAVRNRSQSASKIVVHKTKKADEDEL